MKREARGITGRPRRRVRFWSANACSIGEMLVFSFLPFADDDYPWLGGWI